MNGLNEKELVDDLKQYYSDLKSQVPANVMNEERFMKKVRRISIKQKLSRLVKITVACTAPLCVAIWFMFGGQETLINAVHSLTSSPNISSLMESADEVQIEVYTIKTEEYPTEDPVLIPYRKVNEIEIIKKIEEGVEKRTSFELSDYHDKYGNFIESEVRSSVHIIDLNGNQTNNKTKFIEGKNRKMNKPLTILAPEKPPKGIEFDERRQLSVSEKEQVKSHVFYLIRLLNGIPLVNREQ
ncbi:hypothetical protein [Ammoniphilus sp. 3BR4]|uniref:hypothetical protein n=1 Tax=Ammoniphilus sp. 3BR4 TaxID=3158265 RepID=UPI00346521DB